MSATLLFCVDNVSIETVNALLRSAELPAFSLVRSPSQETFDPRGTSAPVYEFTNGFTGYSANHLQEFVTSRLTEDVRLGTFLQESQLVILDERSQRDKTVIIWKALAEDLMHEPDPSDLTDSGDGSDVEDIWCCWRVKFEHAETLLTRLEFNLDMWPTLCRKDLVGDDGIFDLERAHSVQKSGG